MGKEKQTTPLYKSIDAVLAYFASSSFEMDQMIFKRYLILRDKIGAEDINYNPIKGSVRAYLDAHSDYDNPILQIMGELETKIDLILHSQKANHNLNET